MFYRKYFPFLWDESFIIPIMSCASEHSKDEKWV